MGGRGFNLPRVCRRGKARAREQGWTINSKTKQPLLSVVWVRRCWRAKKGPKKRGRAWSACEGAFNFHVFITWYIDISLERTLSGIAGALAQLPTLKIKAMPKTKIKQTMMSQTKSTATGKSASPRISRETGADEGFLSKGTASRYFRQDGGSTARRLGRDLQGHDTPEKDRNLCPRPRRRNRHGRQVQPAPFHAPAVPIEHHSVGCYRARNAAVVSMNLAAGVSSVDLMLTFANLSTSHQLHARCMGRKRDRHLDER